MTRVVRVLVAVLMLAAAPGAARAETPAVAPKPEWSTALYVDGYFRSGEAAFLVPTVFADRGPLHLEARYNYEAFDTGSLFAGYSFSFGGEEDYLKLTPMLGGVFGDVNGVAPGLEVEARWGRVSYWLESEYLFDLQDSAGNYLYTWSELGVTVVPWLWVGGSVQRLKTIDSPTEVDVGPMVGVGKQGAPGWSLSFYAYGLTRSDPSYLVTAAVLF